MSKILLTAMCVLALGLGACGGSGKRAVASLVETAAEQRAAVIKAIRVATDTVTALDGESTDAEVTAAQGTIAAARKAVRDADTLSGEERDRYDKLIASLDRSLADKRSLIAKAREDERRKAAADVARLAAALAGARITGIAAAVKHGAPPVMSGTLPGTPAVPVAGLKTAAVAGGGTTVGAWRGGRYAAADAAAGTADTVVLYTDIEAPGRRPFGGEGGRYVLAEDGSLAIGPDADAALIASSSFPTGAGTVTHEAGVGGAVEIAGTFDGAAGTYVCVPTPDSGCTSAVRSGGGIGLAGGSGWKFVPAAEATVPTLDGEHRYFGWWLRETGDGFAVGVFHGGAGGAEDEFADLAAQEGTATYRGPAAGQVALGAAAGAFTATATLEADFGDGTARGTVRGTVGGFRVGGASMPWSVELRAAAIGADGTIATGGVATALTYWTVAGDKGAKAATWSGRFHEVGADRIPKVATGAFEAVHGETARMTGASGTTRQ